MTSKKSNAFLKHTQSNNLATFTFNTSNTYEMPVALLTSDIQQFESVLTFAAKLIELEKSLSDDYIKGTVFADYIKSIELKHAELVSNLEKQSSSEITQKLSGLVQTISEKDLSFNDQIKQLRADYELQIKNLSKEKKKMEEDATAIKQELELTLQKELKALRKQLSEKES